MNGALPHRPDARFLSVAEVATILRVSEVTIYREITRGGIAAVKIRGRYVIPAKALDQLEAEAIDAAEQRDTEYRFGVQAALP